MNFKVAVVGKSLIADFTGERFSPGMHSIKESEYRDL